MDDELIDIAESAMETIADPARWEGLCDKIATRMGASAFIVYQYDLQAHAAPIVHAGSSMRGLGAPLIAIMAEGVPPEEEFMYSRAAAAPQNAFRREIDLLSVDHDRDLPPNPFRDRLLAASEAKSRSGMRLNSIGPALDMAAMHLPQIGAEVPRELRRRMSTVARLLSKTIESGRVVSGLTQRFSMLLELFDRLDFGAAFCEPGGRIITPNRRFDEIARERDGLTGLGGIAGAVHTEDAATLRRAMERASHPDAAAAESMVSLRRRSQRLPLIVRTAPVKGAAHDRPGQSSVLVLVVDPEDEARLSTAGLAALGRLTTAEAAICQHLVRGMPVEEIAERQSLGAESLQRHIAAASSKLACRDRMELVRLAMSTQIPVPPSGPPQTHATRQESRSNK